jgi:hypothetical protein
MTGIIALTANVGKSSSLSKHCVGVVSAAKVFSVCSQRRTSRSCISALWALRLEKTAHPALFSRGRPSLVFTKPGLSELGG